MTVFEGSRVQELCGLRRYKESLVISLAFRITFLDERCSAGGLSFCWSSSSASSSDPFPLAWGNVH